MAGLAWFHTTGHIRVSIRSTRGGLSYGRPRPGLGTAGLRLSYGMPKPGFHTARPGWAVSWRVQTGPSVGGPRPSPQSTGTDPAQSVGPDQALSRRARPTFQTASPNQAVSRPAPAWLSYGGHQRVQSASAGRDFIQWAQVAGPSVYTPRPGIHTAGRGQALSQWTPTGLLHGGL